jgi:hypothetical protein
MGIPLMMLPVTEVSNPPAPAEHSFGNGLYVVGYETMRFCGTLIENELTLMVPPALYSVPAVQLLQLVYHTKYGGGNVCKLTSLMIQ